LTKKIIFGRKNNFWPKKIIFGRKKVIFGRKNNFCPKKNHFWEKKYFLMEKNTFWSKKKFFWSKKNIFWSKKNIFWSKKNIFWSKENHFWEKKNFWPKNHESWIDLSGGPWRQTFWYNYNWKISKCCVNLRRMFNFSKCVARCRRENIAGLHGRHYINSAAGNIFQQHLGKNVTSRIRIGPGRRWFVFLFCLDFFSKFGF